MTTPAGSQTPAHVRTSAPALAAAVIIYLAKRLFDIDLSATEALVLMPVVGAAYYKAARVLEAINPKLGRLLIIAKQPVYSSESAPSPAKDETLVADVVPTEDLVSPHHLEDDDPLTNVGDDVEDFFEAHR